jgi:hypothetical protein
MRVKGRGETKVKAVSGARLNLRSFEKGKKKDIFVKFCISSGEDL